MTLSGKTLFITGASRGIGLAIALRAARDGANIAVVAKTAQPHPKLPGTIYTAAEAIEAAGGKALPLPVDIRDEAAVAGAVAQAVAKFGGIDMLVNNASAINLTGTRGHADEALRSDVRGERPRARSAAPRLACPTCAPSAKAGRNPHILNLSPPLILNPQLVRRAHVAYTMAKYGMSMCVLGMAEEFRRDGIAVNALWPRTVILTAALAMIPGVDPAMCRKPEIMADAAHAVFGRDARQHTGNFYIDEQVLAAEGVTDLDRYAVVPGNRQFLPDLFLD